MTLAEAIRMSRETGCEFWRARTGSDLDRLGSLRLEPRYFDREPMWQQWDCMKGGWRDAVWSIALTVDDVLADDWQTAPHEDL